METKLKIYFTVMAATIIGLLIYIATHRVGYEQQHVLAESNEPKIIIENIGFLESGDILKVSSIVTDESGSIDTVFVKKFDSKIYIPHPTQLFVEVDLKDMTVYTRLDKTIHYGFENMTEINNQLAFIFPKTQAFRRKLTDDEKVRFGISE